MKMMIIAFKDMTRSFRSTFAVMFMFGVPLLMTGMFYLMFGGSGAGNATFSVPVTTVAVANLDKGNPSLGSVNSSGSSQTQGGNMGSQIVSILQGKDLADIIQVTLVDSAEAARAAVDSQKAGAAIIIPADFSDKYADPTAQATLELYKDPTLTIGPGIVQSLLNQIVDSFSGVKMAVSTAIHATGRSDSALINQVVQQSLASAQASEQTSNLLNVQEVSTTKKQTNAIATIIGPIMGWLTLFYAFFTGASTAQSILREDEEGTLPRLFTTPTTHSTVLGGKFLAVGFTVVVQMTVLFFLGRLIFGIPWGSLTSIALVILGVILAASGFGIFINSLLKSTKQAGFIFGGLLTMMGMLGGVPVFVPNSATADTFGKVALIEPVGWAVRGLLQSMRAAPLQDVALTTLVLAGWGVVFFIIGVRRFQKRYA